jgi:hypothetical protein
VCRRRFVICPLRPCHGSGGWSPASYRGGPGSMPGQCMSDLWWTKWHWDRFFSRVLRFSPVSFIPSMLHYAEKRKKKLIIFITGLHNKPQRCGASVASAAGPFPRKKKNCHLTKDQTVIVVKMSGACSTRKRELRIELQL